MGRRRQHFYSYWGFEPSRPREVKGGIKARGRRGGFAASWWGKRWIEVLEGFDIGARLARGRSYARRGQVTELDVSPGRVRARVQGSQSTPYRVEIRLKTLSASAVKKLAASASERPILAAALLVGQMPEDLEEVFQAAGMSLFPSRHADLKTDCSCPDWSNPCKHIAAVYYLLAEAFDGDPFLLLRLRGADRDDLTRLVAAPRSGHPARRARVSGRRPKVTTKVSVAEHSAEPLPSDTALFWNGGGTARTTDAPLLASMPAALLRRLGPIPFWRGEADFLETLTETYAAAAQAARDLLTGPSTIDEDG